MADKITVSTTDKCIAAVQTAIPNISNKLLEVVKNKIEVELKYSNKLEQDAIADAVVSVSADIRGSIKARKYQEYLNLTYRKKVRSFIDQNFSHDPFLGLRAKIGGTSHGLDGSRLSAYSNQHGLVKQYHSGLTGELIRDDLLDKAKGDDVVFNKMVADEMQRLDDQNILPDTGNKDAKRIAELFKKYQEIARKDANDAGANIGTIQSFIARQSHDIDKVRKLGKDGWKELIRSKLDWEAIERSAGKIIEDKENWLDQMYQGIITGTHMRDSYDIPAFDLPSSVAKSLSHNRVLHFKAGEWFDYNLKAGQGNIMSAVLLGLERSARSTGLMKAFGPSAIHNMDMIRNDLMREFNDGSVKTRMSDETYRQYQMRLTGEYGIPGNSKIHSIFQGIRTFQNFKLGASSITGLFGDPIGMASEIKFQGGNLLDGYSIAFSSLFEGVSKKERVAQAKAIGFMADGWISTFTNRFDADGQMSPGAAKINGLWFKANLLTPITDRRKFASGLYFSTIAASRKELPFGELSRDYKNVLSFFEIGEKEWDILRRNAVDEIEGKEIMSVEKIRDIPLDEIKRVHGEDISNYRAEQLRSDLMMKYQSYLTDRTESAVITPDIHTSVIQAGAVGKSGEGATEGIKTLMQFKGFPIAFVDRVINRELFGKKYRGKSATTMVLGSYIVQSIIMGYLTIYTKNILSGKETKSLSDPSMMQRSALIGGGLGFYGDILFGNLEKGYGRTFTSALIGPSGGTLDNMADLIGRAKNGDLKANKVIKQLYRESGITSLFYSKMVLDYAILYNMIDYFDPNYLTRMERRAEKDGRGFFIKPSEVVK